MIFTVSVSYTHLNFDKREFSAVHIMDGWQTWAMRDVSVAVLSLIHISGGWLPLSLGMVMFTVMTTCKSERFRLLRRMHEHAQQLRDSESQTPGMQM